MKARRGNVHRLRIVTLISFIISIGINTVNLVGGGGIFPLKDC